ncbi:MAG: hypothetical protein ACR2PX_15450, partial [Endozoicomonas sp.]|uniref:hypothetical protein n=1 Tax=Endozoicomonas sp. TaxID=1892382 RepID=UPI003D9AE124
SEGVAHMSDPSEILILINQSSPEGYFCCNPSLFISQPVKAPYSLSLSSSFLGITCHPIEFLLFGSTGLVGAVSALQTFFLYCLWQLCLCPLFCRRLYASTKTFITYSPGGSFNLSV